MKKSILAVAGIAAFTGIAMPVAGVFADAVKGAITEHTDTINVKVNEVCTLGTVTNGVAYKTESDGTTSTDQTNHTGTAEGNSFVGTWTNDTLSANLDAGTEKALGSSTFTVRCNAEKGYSISAVGAGTAEHTTELYKAESGDIEAASIATGTGSGFDAATSDSYWGFKFSTEASDLTIETAYASRAAIPGTATVVAKQSNIAGDLNDGEEITVTYEAGINNTQASGTYTGKVKYILAALN